MAVFLFALIELNFFRYTVPNLRGEMCAAWLFLRRVDLVALKFYLDNVIPHQAFLALEN